MKSDQAPQTKSSVCSYRRAVVVVAVLIGLGTAVYILYFKHGAPEDIMAANMARRSHGRTGQGREDAYDYDYDDEEEEDTGPQTPQSTKLKWARWIRKNNYVSIGELFNKCDGDDRLLVGMVLMQPDPVHGGVKSRTYLNHTIDQEVTGGEMFIEVQYNHKELYNNHWELCEVEEGMEDRIIFCPLKTGPKNFVKDLPIPSYLPKGTYTTKAWIQDQDENLIGCAFAEFTL